LEAALKASDEQRAEFEAAAKKAAEAAAKVGGYE
jgi:hypothetical protein